MRAAAPFGKVMGAFLVASIGTSVAAGLILLLLSWWAGAFDLAKVPAILLQALIFGFPIAFAHVLLLALPAYLWLERRYPLCWWNAALAGGAIGAVPMLLWVGPGSALDAVMLWAGTGASGAAGGLIFRLALHDLMRAP